MRCTDERLIVGPPAAASASARACCVQTDSNGVRRSLGRSHASFTISQRVVIAIRGGRPLRGRSSNDSSRGHASHRARHFRTMRSLSPTSREATAGP
jgi:hypothetical protein